MYRVEIYSKGKYINGHNNTFNELRCYMDSVLRTGKLIDKNTKLIISKV